MLVAHEEYHLLIVLQHGLNSCANDMSTIADLISKRFQEENLRFSIVNIITYSIQQYKNNFILFCLIKHRSFIGSIS